MDKMHNFEEMSYKYGLTIEEGTKYFGIGRARLENFLSEHRELYIENGVKKIIKRQVTENFLDKLEVI